MQASYSFKFAKECVRAALTVAAVGCAFVVALFIVLGVLVPAAHGQQIVTYNVNGAKAYRLDSPLYRQQQVDDTGTAHTVCDTGGCNMQNSGLFLLSSPLNAVTATAGATGNVSGTVQYITSCITATGESYAYSGLSTAITVSAKQVTLTNVPLCSDFIATGRKIYRYNTNQSGNAADPNIRFLVGTIADNKSTTYVDNVPDASLGGPESWLPIGYGNVTQTWNGAVQSILSVGNISTAVGVNSGGAGGYANTSIGANALGVLTYGLRDVALGADVFETLTTGSRDTGAGVHCGDQTTTGDDIACFGYLALGDNTTGSELTAVGSGALNHNTTHNQSSAFGYNALYLADADNNDAFGWNAASSITSGTQNSIKGTVAGLGITTGNYNTCDGFSTCNNIATGSQNTHIGWNAGASGDYTNTIAIGQGATATKSNQAVIGASGTTETDLFGVVENPGGIVGAATVPSGSCSVVQWMFTADGHAAYCNGTTWATKI